VRDRRDVGDRGDLEARGLERADRRLAAGAGTADEDLDALEPEVERLACRILGRDLGSVRRALARALPITFPAGSVSDTIVLLKDAFTCAAPRGTTRFSRRRRGAAFGSAPAASRPPCSPPACASAGFFAPG